MDTALHVVSPEKLLLMRVFEQAPTQDIELELSWRHDNVGYEETGPTGIDWLQSKVLGVEAHSG